MRRPVTVVDYGIGNLHSVVKALAHEGGEVDVTSDPMRVRSADRLVLPGVAAFADGMKGLEERHLVEVLREYFSSGRPFLGICLGMQLLLAESEEFGTHLGLGFIEGKVVQLPRQSGVKVPHVGWNALQAPAEGRWAGSILEDTPEQTAAYFVHSFAAVPAQEQDWLASTYNGNFCIAAAVRRHNVTGCQFHPEKSGAVGLRMIARFLES
jgi:glutamine amidotransferase